jgi:hypothetical protein
MAPRAVSTKSYAKLVEMASDRFMPAHRSRDEAREALASRGS